MNRRTANENDELEIQVVGPFASEYSLARVNRNLALALLEQDVKTSLLNQQEFVDVLYSGKHAKNYPELAKIVSNKQSNDVAIFNNFPRSITDDYGLKNLKAELKLGYLAWEESVFPKHFVEECNRELHAMLVPSEHVLEIFRRSGLKIPMFNVGEGINQDLPELARTSKYKLKTRRKLKFFHISSGMYRKGVDVLLKAYFSEFSNRDDVCLILKIFVNSDNQVQKLITEIGAGRKDLPEIELINENELSEAEIASLYDQADIVVLPSRAEGFGLPMAEAMLMRRPLITTDYSGQLDFCNAANCWLLDYKLVDSQSHLNIPKAKVAEPDMQQLAALLKRFYNLTRQADDEFETEIKTKLKNAFLTAKKLTWANTAKSTIKAINQTWGLIKLKQQKLAVITTYNTRCGIAVYSKDLYNRVESSFAQIKYLANSDAIDHEYPDNGDLVSRTWEYSENDFSETLTYLDKYQPQVVNIQYNPPFYSLEALSLLIEGLKARNIKTVLTIHSLAKLEWQAYRERLNLADVIVAHSLDEQDHLRQLGIKATFLPHGINEFTDIAKTKLRNDLSINYGPIIASHGMIHDKKGLLEALDAIAILKKDYPNILFLGMNAVNNNNLTSQGVYQKMLEKIAQKHLEKNVVLITDFLESIEIIRLLQLADIIVLPYADLNEGASGAVRYAFSASRPVIITNSYIFKDLTAGYRIESNQPQKIADAVKILLNDRQLYQTELNEIHSFVKANSWEKVALDYLEMFI